MTLVCQNNAAHLSTHPYDPGIQSERERAGQTSGQEFVERKKSGKSVRKSLRCLTSERDPKMIQGQESGPETITTL